MCVNNSKERIDEKKVKRKGKKKQLNQQNK